MNNLLIVISALSEQHASSIKLSEINKFYRALESINDDSCRVLANVTWLILFYESKGRQSVTKQMREQEQQRRAYALSPEGQLSPEHESIIRNVITYTEEAQCLK